MRKILLTGAVTAAMLVPSSALANEEQILGGWFGNWHPPATVTDRMAAGSGVLTDAAIFAWGFGGADNPVCVHTPKSACSAPGVVSTQNLRKSLAAMSGSRVWASHTDLNYQRAGELAAMLRNKSQRKALIKLLVQRTEAVGADGLDLDWENFAFNDGASSWSSTRRVLNPTVRRLAKKLHARGKLLSVTVPVGAAPLTASGSPRLGGGYSVFDWKRLAAAADQLNLMTYDYSFSSPGPIGPHGWVKQAATAATRSVAAADRRKIVVGVPLYGKSWPTPGYGGQATVGECPDGWRPRSITPTFSLGAISAAELAKEKGVRIKFARKAGEATFRYSETAKGTYPKKVGTGKNRRTVTRTKECQVSRTVWFGNNRTAIKRAKLARKMKIGGIFAWNLASAQDQMFARYQQKWPRANSSDSTATTPAASPTSAE